MKDKKRIILGVSGASGAILAYHTAKALKAADVELYMVVTESAHLTWDMECDMPFSALTELADVYCDMHDMAADISSGSFRTDGMLIVPCSMKTLAGLVSGYSDNLLLRAADVCLKEGRKVVLCPREMPFGKIHLRNMKEAADLGCAVVPPVLSFYSGQMTVQDQIDHVVGKLLMQLDIPYENFRPWSKQENGK